MASVLAGCKPVAGHSLQFAFAMHYALSLVHLNVLYFFFHIPGHVTIWLAHEAKLLSLQRCPQRSSKPRRCEEPLQKGCRILALVMSFMSHVNACHAVLQGCQRGMSVLCSFHCQNSWLKNSQECLRCVECVDHLTNNAYHKLPFMIVLNV